MFTALRLRYGMFWPTKNPPMPWKTLLVIILGLGMYLFNSHYTQLQNQVANLEETTAIKQSYLKVVLGVMNGDARIQVGNELFACTGGFIGTVDGIKQNGNQDNQHSN